MTEVQLDTASGVATCLQLVQQVRQALQLGLLEPGDAGLDPLARREFLRNLMEVVAAQGTSVLLSSHLIADLERVIPGPH